jgi:hypothetical protein
MTYRIEGYLNGRFVMKTRTFKRKQDAVRWARRVRDTAPYSSQNFIKLFAKKDR